MAAILASGILIAMCPKNAGHAVPVSLVEWKAGTTVSEADIKAGKLHVFDTSKFTVAGEHITTNKVDFSYMDWSTNPPSVVHQGATKETIKTDTYGTYVEESVERSAPYFSLRIDGITEVAKAAKN